MPTRLMILVGALLLTLAACGGDTADTTVPTLPTLSDETTEAVPETTSTTEALDPEEAFQEYTECMREHGIDMPDPGSEDGMISIEGSSEDLDFSALDEAAAECDPILEAAFGEFELNPEQQAELMDQELAFAQCMRDTGVDWPDPDPNGGNTIALPDDVDPETVDAAIGKCSEEAFGAGGLVIGGETP